MMITPCEPSSSYQDGEPKRGWRDGSRTFATTLRSLALDRSIKDIEGCWRPALTFLEQDMQLERLQMSRLDSIRPSCGPGEGLYMNETGVTDFSFQGRVVVKEGLNILRERARYENEE